MSAPAKRLHLSFILPFIIHTLFQTFQILVSSCLHRVLCSLLVCGEQIGVGMLSHLVFDSDDTPGVLLEIYALLGFLSASSWNYLGAKLIALDPTSRCNRLSANLGFSQCSQVSSRRSRCTGLSTALFSPKVLTPGAAFHTPLC